jgi:hypothetical protein
MLAPVRDGPSGKAMAIAEYIGPSRNNFVWGVVDERRLLDG